MPTECTIIHAPNVHQGGGRTLLRALLATSWLKETNRPVHLILDDRFELADREISSVLPRATVHRIAPSLWSRWQAERLLLQLSGPDTRILCFAGQPPLFPCDGHVAVFVQNRIIISRTDLTGFSRTQRARIELERLWFRSRAENATEFIVQTETMHDLLEQLLPGASIHVRPFIPVSAEKSDLQLPQATEKSFDFCYIATGEPHKNHRKLIEAWCLLARTGVYPALCLTVGQQQSPELHDWIEGRRVACGLKLENVGYLPPAQIEHIYGRSHRLIFPSHYESFGLPLLEAERHQLPIVAAERDYVRDVVNPEATFDPESARSIARAVQRVLGQCTTPSRFMNPEEFLTSIFSMQDKETPSN